MSFKVGDWVHHKYLNTIFQVKDIFKDGYLDCITSLKLEPRIKWDSCLFQGKYNSDDFRAKTEPEAIFLACEWLLENKDKQ